MLAAPIPAHAAQRGYELVTPADLGSYNPLPAGSTADGSALYWATGQGQGSGDPAPEDGSQLDVYVARRGASTWSSSWLSPHPHPELGQVFLPGTSAVGLVYRTTWDAAPNDQNHSPSAFVDVYDLYRSDGSGVSLLSAAPGGSTGSSGVGILRGTAVTPGLDAVAFETPDTLLPEDGDGDVDVYLRRGSELLLLSRATDGTPSDFSGDAQIMANPEQANALSGFPASQGVAPLSSTGDAVVFYTDAALDPADGDLISDLYLWRDGSVSLISDGALPAPDCTTTADEGLPECRATFAGMAHDASRIYFATTEQLVAGDTDSAGDLYEYRFSGTPALRLASGDATSEARPVSVSRDGDLFFRSDDPVGVDPPAAGPALYRWHDGVVRTVSALDPADPTGDNYFVDASYYANDGLRPPGLDHPFPLGRPIRVSFDGDAALFATLAPLTAGDTDDRVDLYLWRAGSGVTLVSAGGDGSHPAQMGGGVEVNNAGLGGRVISADARRIFFMSADALAPGAADNDRPKVYEWEDGVVSLVSPPGGQARNAYYVDSSESGDSVFFQTSQALVAADDDGDAVDFYVAKTGSTFTYPTTSSDVGGAPSGGSATPPPAASIPSLAPSQEPPPPPGIPPQPPEVIAPGIAVRGDVTATRRAAKVGLDVALPGRVRLVIRERGDESRVLARARIAVADAGRVRVSVPLTRAGRRLVRAGDPVPVRVRAVLVTDDGAAADLVRTRMDVPTKERGGDR